MEKKNNNKNGLSLSSWSWPSCNHPRTSSFGALDHQIFDYSSCFTELQQQEEEHVNSESYTTTSEEAIFDQNGVRSDTAVESLIKQARSDRLFFDPETTATIAASTPASSLVNEVINPPVVPVEGSIAVEVDSEDVYEDFRASIEEMVVCNGGEKGVEWLEAMLAWYLKANEKSVHGVIISAFVDVLVMKLQQAAAASASSSVSNSDNISTDSSSYSCHDFSSCSSTTLLLDQVFDHNQKLI